MRKLLTLSMLLVALMGFGQNLIITGVIDGPLVGGTPKAVELYVTADIADLSLYGLGSATNGGGTDGVEFTGFSGSASNGDFIYVATESTEFNSWFGFNPDFTTSAVNINGDDAIELFYDVSGLFSGGQSVIDVFGEITHAGGISWSYMDGWAYRNDVTGPDGSTWTEANWTFSGENVLDGETANASASNPFPVGSYSSVAGDNTAPVWSPSFPYLDNLTATSFDIFGQIDEPGTIYYLVIPNDAIAPSSTDITSGSYAGTTLFSGNIPVTTALSTVSASLTGLIEGLDYDVYVVAQDDESTPNVQTVPIKLNFPPELIAITEFLNNSLGTNSLDPSTGDETTNEWIELYNYGSNAVDLAGWTISDEDSDSDAIGSITINPGDYVILAKSKTYFETQWLGGVPDSRVIQLAITLADGADEIILSNNEGDAIWSLAYPSGLSVGNATYLGYSESSSTTVYGNKASPGIVIGGNDTPGTTGYENSADPEVYTSTSGDTGSPLDGQYASPLPVELISFEGRQEGSEVILEWQTVTESSNDGFEVFKSLDGETFSPIGFVNGSGDSNEKRYYSFEDKKFLQTAYYQLKQIDFDGKFEMTKIIQVVSDFSPLLIYPNPIQDHVNISIPEGEFKLTIYDMRGQLLHHNFTDVANAEKIIIDLKKGNYIVDLQSINFRKEFTILKQ